MSDLNHSWGRIYVHEDSDDDESNSDASASDIESDIKSEKEDLEEDGAEAKPKPRLTVHQTREALWHEHRQFILEEHVKSQIAEDAQSCNTCQLPATIICKTCDFSHFCEPCDAKTHVNNNHQRMMVNNVGVKQDLPGGLLPNGIINLLSVHPPQWFIDCQNNFHCIQKQPGKKVTFVDLNGISMVLLPVFQCKTCQRSEVCNISCLLRSGYWFSSPQEKYWSTNRYGRNLVVFDTRVFDLLATLRSGNTGLSAGMFMKALFQYGRSRSSTAFSDVAHYTFTQAFKEYSIMKINEAALKEEPFDRCEPCGQKCNGLSVDGIKTLIRYNRKEDDGSPAISYFSCTALAEKEEENFKAAHTGGSNPVAARCGSTKLTNAKASNQGADSAAKKTAALDETGCITAVCKHNITHSYCDMNAGEKYGRVSAVLASALDKVSSCQMLYFDNMCVLKKSLQYQLQKRPDSELLQKIWTVPRKCVPTFHVSTHNVFCKINNSPQYITGAGASSGEICEVQNSKATAISRITKMANKPNRLEELELMFFNLNTANQWNVSLLLCKQLRRYEKELEELEDLLDMTRLAKYEALEQRIIKYIASCKNPKEVQLNEAGRYMEAYVNYYDHQKGTLVGLTRTKNRLLKQMCEEDLMSAAVTNFVSTKCIHYLNQIEELDLEVKYLATAIRTARGSNHRGTIRASQSSKKKAKEDLERKYNATVRLAARHNIATTYEEITDQQGYAEIKGCPKVLESLSAVSGYTRWKRVSEEIRYLHEEIANLTFSRCDRYRCLLQEHEKCASDIKALAITSLRPLLYNDLCVLKRFERDHSLIQSVLS